MKRPGCYVTAFALLTLLTGCTRPEGPDPFAGLLLYPNEIEADHPYEGDVPLRAWVENWGDEPFVFSGELTVQRDGIEIDTIPFGQLATGAEEGKTVWVQEVCSPSQNHVYIATIEYSSSITAAPEAIDVNMSNNTNSITDGCQLIYERSIEVFRQACLERVNSLRALENLPALTPPTAQHQACSDADAKANHESGDPHGSKCGAQNTCGDPYGTFDEVLDTCIEAQMYYHEKANYQKNPNSCYHASWPDTCGHYVNMTDKQNAGYKELACGLYVTPGGKTYVLLNFFS